MMSNIFYGQSDVDREEMMMTAHHSCGDGDEMHAQSGDNGAIYDKKKLSNIPFLHLKKKMRAAPHSKRKDHTQMNTDCRSLTERRLMTHRLYIKNLFCTYKVLNIFISLCIFISSSSAQSTACDFKGSGLDMKEKAVQPVYLSCSSGRLDWHYPRGALRILMQYPGGDGREFHGCIKASPEIQGAHLYVEGHRSLVPIYASDDALPNDRMRCFTSHQGRVGLYLEADPVVGFKDLLASFEYDLQVLPKGEVYDPLEDCRPCSSEELVSLYCSADFAAKGFIVSAEDDPQLRQTRVTLAASRVFQQTRPVFSSARQKSSSSGLPTEVLSNEIREDDDTQDLFGNLYMPLDCGARAGIGEFMVLGSIRLGQPVLRCAPRIEEWKTIVNNVQDRAHCILES